PLHTRPVVVDDRVPRGVANRVRKDHVLLEDPLERRPDAEECAAYAEIARVRLELHPHQSAPVERVREQEVLRLDVRSSPPLRPLEPGPADLRSTMEGLDVEVARRAYGPVVDDHDERDLVLRGQRLIEPAPEAEGVHVGEAVDLWLALRRFANAVTMPFTAGGHRHAAPPEAG